jgi:hypothetical protein
MIDRTYGHLARDSDESIRNRPDARAARSDVEMASGLLRWRQDSKAVLRI